MVTAILTVWKRNYLEEQLNRLLAQVIPPEEIWVYQCHNYINVENILKKFPLVKYQFNTNNLSYFGRFSLGLHVKTPYLYILDDDVIPSFNWIENCLKTCFEKNSIVGSSGRIIPFNDYSPEMVKSRKHYYECYIGDYDNLSSANYCPKDTFIDYGCNSWFFKTEWLKYFWSIKPYTFDSGEDIHLSASCQIMGNIKTICPFQDGKVLSGNMMKYYGWDSIASHKKQDFHIIREKIFRYLIDTCGWTPLTWHTRI